MDRACRDCRFRKTGTHECRRHAPMVFDRSWTSPAHGLVSETVTAWPEIAETDWCGDFDAENPLSSRSRPLRRLPRHGSYLRGGKKSRLVTSPSKWRVLVLSKLRDFPNERFAFFGPLARRLIWKRCVTDLADFLR